MNPIAFPAATGQWTLSGNLLRCRLPRRTIEVQAPGKLLSAVSDVCDGTHDWQSALSTLSDRWDRTAVQSFLAGLAANGLLVEATGQVAAAAELGWAPTEVPRLLDAEALPLHRHLLQVPLFTAPPADGRSAVPSDMALRLARRRTASTFGNLVVSGQSLVNILWSMCGITHCSDDKAWRTVPSAGGLYAVDWYVALLRDNDWYETGLYKLAHHAAGNGPGLVSLERLPGAADGAWSTMLAPAILAHASAALYPVARLDDIAAKYSNRALTFALIEVGHSCQNGALAALDEGAAGASRGDTIETAVQCLFGLTGGRYPMPAWVVGTAPTADDVDQAFDSAKSFALATVPDAGRRLKLATSLASAGPIRIGITSLQEIWASGRETCPRLASVKAEAEAWERIGWSTPGVLVPGAQVDVANAIDPRGFVRYSAAQHRRLDFPFEPWSVDASTLWTPGIELNAGRKVMLPAQCVFSLASLPATATRRPFTNASTSGVAAHTSAEEAINRALVELVERDAFSRAWLAQQALPLVGESSLSTDQRERVSALRSAGYDVGVHRLTSRFLPAVLVSARDRRRSFTSVTTGAGFRLKAAIESALLETETKVQDAHGKPPVSDSDARSVRDHRGHGLHFRTRRGHADADALLSSASASLTGDPSANPPTPRDGVGLRELFATAKMPVYACDLTPKGAALAQGRNPLHVWRVLVPGLVPLWFGRGQEPWGLINDLAIEFSPALRRSRKLHPCT